MGDYRTTTGEAKPLPAGERRQRLVRLLTVSGLSAAAVIAAGFLIRVPRIVLASGYVTTREYAEVRPSVAGTVSEIRARSGDTVKAGDVLVRLDEAEAVAAAEEVRSQARKAQAELSRRETEIAQQKRTLIDEAGIARLKQQNAKSKLDRAAELNSRGLAAGATVEDFRLQAELAQAELAALTNRDLTVFDRELDVLRHEVAGRAEAVARAEAQVRLRQARAPIGGQVVRYEFVLGELVRPETVLYEVFGGGGQTLKLRVDERHATQVAPGQTYRARLTSYGGLHRVWFRGEVEDLRNVIQVDGQKTYRTVYCRFDAGARSVPPGTTAEARIHTGRIPLWLYLLGLD